jgi:hypothetical protein
MLEALNALAVLIFSFINEQLLKIIWTIIVAPGIFLSGFCLFIYITDERIRQKEESERRRTGRVIDAILRITSHVVVSNEVLRFFMHLTLVIITVTAWLSPTRGGPSSPPTAATLVTIGGLILLAVLLDVKSIITLIGRYRIDRVAKAIPSHRSMQRRSTDKVNGELSRESERSD